jgi:hypothetical protein
MVENVKPVGVTLRYGVDRENMEVSRVGTQASTILLRQGFRRRVKLWRDKTAGQEGPAEWFEPVVIAA